MTEPAVFLNHQYLPFSQAKIPFYDMGLVMGVTFTEMARTFDHQLFRAQDHVARLFHSLEYAGIELDDSPAVILEHLRELTRRNAALIKPEEELGVVIFVTPGGHSLYAGAQSALPLSPTLCIHSFMLPFSSYRHLFLEGAHVVVPATRHVPPQCVDATTKHRSRLHWWTATREARRSDPHAMPLLLDLEGNITETATANFMMVRGDALIIPRPQNILHGISLQTTMELATEMGMKVIRQNVRLEDVTAADEAWLTSTPFCIAPCTKINDTTISDGNPGPRWKKVLSVWSDLVKKDIYAQIVGGEI